MEMPGRCTSTRLEIPNGVFATRFRRTEDASDLTPTGDNTDIENREVSPQQWREKFRPITRVLEVVRPLQNTRSQFDTMAPQAGLFSHFWTSCTET